MLLERPDIWSEAPFLSCLLCGHEAPYTRPTGRTARRRKARDRKKQSFAVTKAQKRFLVDWVKRKRTLQTYLLHDALEAYFKQRGIDWNNPPDDVSVLPRVLR
jgi:hypothetical protein